jgi:hypothetical protein
MSILETRTFPLKEPKLSNLTSCCTHSIGSFYLYQPSIMIFLYQPSPLTLTISTDSKAPNPHKTMSTLPPIRSLLDTTAIPHHTSTNTRTTHQQPSLPTATLPLRPHITPLSPLPPIPLFSPTPTKPINANSLDSPPSSN